MAVWGSLLRMPRRRMAGKRMFIGVACTMCLVLGVYIKFFNHESSDQLLLANRQSVQDDVVIVQAKPNFHRLGAIKKQGHEEVHEHVQKLETQTLIDTVDKSDTLIQKDDNDKAELDKVIQASEEKVDEAKHKGNEEKVDEWADDDQENDLHEDVAEHEDNQVNDEVDQQPFDVDKPIERVEGRDEEENDELRDAGEDGGEREEEEEEEGEEEDGAHSNGRGAHGIKSFDWDQWVKENEFVDLGNIWGYCGDDDPPIIGKLILVEDEERGGVKAIFLFNITIDKDVLMGKVEISIDYHKMHFYTNQFDLSDLEVEGDFFKTPIVKGDHYFVHEQHISSFAPKGHYYGEVQMTDQTDRVIICGTMNLNIT